MEEKNDWKKWRNWFLYAVAIIVVYKLLDNFSNVAAFLKNLWGVTACEASDCDCCCCDDCC